MEKKSIFLRVLLIGIIASLAIAADSCCGAMGHGEHSMSGKTIGDTMTLGTSVQLEGYSVSYKFSAKPAKGKNILIVSVLDSKGKQVIPYTIFGSSGMPSMPGMDSEQIELQLNAKKEYTLPVDVSMQGEWQVKITIKKANKDIFNGVIPFQV